MPDDTAAAATAPRPPGRPRSEEARRAILDAAFRLVAARGYAAVTVQAIAEAAGAGKQTLYRWWPGKAALVLDALAEAGRARIDRPQAAAIARGDVARFLRAAFLELEAAAPALRGLMAEAQADPALRRLLRERLVEPRRAALRALLARRVPDSALREAAVVAIGGATWYRLLLDEKLDDALAAGLAALVPAGEGDPAAAAAAGSGRRPPRRAPPGVGGSG